MKFYIVTLDVANLKDLERDKEVFVTYSGIYSDEMKRFVTDGEGRIIVVYQSARSKDCEALCCRGIDYGSASAILSCNDVNTPEGRKKIAEAIRGFWGVEWLEVSSLA